MIFLDLLLLWTSIIVYILLYYYYFILLTLFTQIIHDPHLNIMHLRRTISSTTDGGDATLFGRVHQVCPLKVQHLRYAMCDAPLLIVMTI